MSDIPPKDFAEGAGQFDLLRARRLVKRLTPYCGSPIELMLACYVDSIVRGMDATLTIALTDEDVESAPQFYLRPQHQIGAHRVDFLIGRAGKQPIIVECDGREFHHSTRSQIERDRARDADLLAKGFRVIRYPGTEIHNNPWRVVTEIVVEVDRDWYFAFWQANLEFTK